MDWLNSVRYNGDNQTIIVLKQKLFHEMARNFNNLFADNDNDNGGCYNLGKLLDNEIFKRSKYLQVFAVIFIVSFTVSSAVFSTQVSSKLDEEKLKQFDKMMDKDKIREIYKTCLGSLKPEASVFGTEYVGGENGKIWLQLLNPEKQYISNATCLATVYYPNGNLLFENLFMNYQNKGIYYYDLTIPRMSGVYPVVAECFYNTSLNKSVATSGGINIGTLESGSYISTQIDDGVYLKVKESGGRVDIGLNFSGITEPVGLTDLVVYLNGIWKMEKDDIPNDYLTFYIWNYTSNSWLEFTNKVYYSDLEQTVTNSLPITNLTSSGLASGGNMRIRINDTGLTDNKVSKIQIDYFYLGLVALYEGFYEEVKGSGEIHVSQGKGYYFQTNCGLDEYGCGVFTNDNEFVEPEGEIEDNITIYSIANQEIENSFVYETPHTVDCSGVYWIKHYENGSWVDITDQVSFQSSVQNENCIITIPITLQPNGVDNYWIKMDNYLKWEVDWSKDLIDGMRDDINNWCYQINSTHEYYVPINETTYLGEGNTKFCHRAIDDLYWFDSYYNDSLGINTTNDYLSYLVEARFYRREIFDEYHKLKTISEVNYTYFDTQFNQTWFNQQSIYNYLQDMNTTLVNEQEYIKSKLNDVWDYVQEMINNLYGLIIS